MEHEYKTVGVQSGIKRTLAYQSGNRLATIVIELNKHFTFSEEVTEETAGLIEKANAEDSPEVTKVYLTEGQDEAVTALYNKLMALPVNVRKGAFAFSELPPVLNSLTSWS